MLTKRIIACLDIKDGRVVKGVNFEGLRDAGDPIELAKQYASAGADELVFLDISATNEKRKTLLDLVRGIAEVINIPFTVGGGITSKEDVYLLLNAGADKVSINTAAFNNPELIKELASEFGSQCIVVAIDVRFFMNDWYVHLNGGRIRTGTKAMDWAKKAEEMGAGELLLTSMDGDGTKSGFDIEITRSIGESVHIPLIASGGAGKMEHFKDVFNDGMADAALAASIFHYKETEIRSVKKYLKANNINVRI